MPERGAEPMRKFLGGMIDACRRIERVRGEFLEDFDEEGWLRRAGISRELADELSVAARAEGERNVAAIARQRLERFLDLHFGGLARPPGLVVAFDRDRDGGGPSPRGEEGGPPRAA